MRLQLPNHPVGTKFLGYRRLYRNNQGSRSPIDPDSDAEASLGQSYPGTLEGLTVAEYSPSGIFVRLDCLGGISYASAAEILPDGSISTTGGSRYGYWARAENYEVIEELP